jgi:hypothetical protein
MTRRLWPLALVGVVALVATAVVVATRRDAPTPRVQAPEVSGLHLVVFRLEDASLGAVVGSTGFGRTGTLVVPPEALVTVPGQGDAIVGEALELPPREAATAVGNLLGVWVDHYAVVTAEQLAAAIDAAGGIEIGGESVSGDETLARLADPATGGARTLQVVLEAMASDGVSLGASDLSESDDAAAVETALSGARDARVVVLPVEEAGEGVFRAESDAVVQALADAFGGPREDAISVIVLNGNGVPGVGELVAEKILPGGFRVVVSENASSFDHDETLVVVGSSGDVALAQRVRDLLGVGSVSVSVGSGIAPVTVVVGKDFIG